MFLSCRPSFALVLGTIPVLVQRCEDRWAQSSQPVRPRPSRQALPQFTFSVCIPQWHSLCLGTCLSHSSLTYCLPWCARPG